MQQIVFTLFAYFVIKTILYAYILRWARIVKKYYIAISTNSILAIFPKIQCISKSFLQSHFLKSIILFF